MNPKLKYLAAERASLLCQPLSSIEIGGMTTTTTDSDRESFLSKTSVHDQAVLLLSIADIAQSELQSRGTIQLWEEDEDFPKFPILSSSNCVGTAGVGDDAINDRAVTVNKPPSLVPRIHARLNSNNVSSSSSPSSSFPRWADSTAPRTVWATAVATAAAAKTGPNRIRSVSLDLQSHVLLRDCSIDMDEVEDDEDNQCNHLLFQGDVDSQRRTPSPLSPPTTTKGIVSARAASTIITPIRSPAITTASLRKTRTLRSSNRVVGPQPRSQTMDVVMEDDDDTNGLVREDRRYDEEDNEEETEVDQQTLGSSNHPDVDGNEATRYADFKKRALQGAVPKGVPIRRVMRRKFSWKNYPELEQFLITNREDYLRHSALNYTVQQKQYNNNLTDRLLELSTEHGYVFDEKDFNFVTVRDRIRCYYKSYVQSAKKRGILMGYAARKAALLSDREIGSKSNTTTVKTGRTG